MLQVDFIKQIEQVFQNLRRRSSSEATLVKLVSVSWLLATWTCQEGRGTCLAPKFFSSYLYPVPLPPYLMTYLVK